MSPDEYVAHEAQNMLACLPEPDRAAVETWHAADVARAAANARRDALDGVGNAQAFGVIFGLLGMLAVGIAFVNYETLPTCHEPPPLACPAPPPLPTWQDASPLKSDYKIEKLVVGLTTCTRVTAGDHVSSSCTETKP